MTVYNVWYTTTFEDTIYLDKVFTSLQEALKFVAGQMEWLSPTEEKMWITAETL